VAATSLPRFINAEFADMHFMFGFSDGNSLTVLEEFQHQYPDQRQPYRHVFETVRVGRGRRNGCGEEDVSDDSWTSQNDTHLFKKKETSLWRLTLKLFDLKQQSTVC
jgi:hypothetical protein